MKPDLENSVLQKLKSRTNLGNLNLVTEENRPVVDKSGINSEENLIYN